MIDEISVGAGALAFALLLIWFFFAKREKPAPLTQVEGPVLSEVEGSRAPGKAGSEAQDAVVSPETLNNTTITLQGMTCDSCVLAIEKALAHTPGVLNASVNLATERATVRYDPRQVATYLLRFNLGAEPGHERVTTLVTFIEQHGGRIDNDMIIALLSLITAMPEYQLC